jgi:hypothetical protein
MPDSNIRRANVPVGYLVIRNPNSEVRYQNRYMYHISNRPSLQAYFRANRLSEAEFYFPIKWPTDYSMCDIYDFCCFYSMPKEVLVTVLIQLVSYSYRT